MSEKSNSVPSETDEDSVGLIDPSETPEAPTEPLDPAAVELKRREACFEEIKASLEKHRCYLLPGWDEPVPVGTNGVTFQISANWTLRSQTEEEPRGVQVRR